MSKAGLLIVEDEENLGITLRDYFRSKGYTVEWAASIAAADSKSNTIASGSSRAGSAIAIAATGTGTGTALALHWQCTASATTHTHTPKVKCRTPLGDCTTG